MDPRHLRPFGRTPLRVTEISYGAAPIGGLFRAIDSETARSLLSDAWEHGVRYFDTAPMYGHGLSEHRVGAFLLDHKDPEVVVSSKVGRTLTPAPHGSFDPGAWADVPPMKADFDYSYDGVMLQVEQILQRMMRARIDILFLHDVDWYTHADQQPRRFREALQGAIPALLNLREQGVVSAIGAGVNNVDVLEACLEAFDLDCLLVAGRYTLLDHDASRGLMDECARRGVAVVAGGVFNSGVLATGPVSGAKFNYAEADPEVLARAQRLLEECEAFGVPLAAAAIQFAGAHPAVASVCLGARTLGQQRSNYEYASWAIPPGLWDALRAQGLISDWAPTP